MACRTVPRHAVFVLTFHAFWCIVIGMKVNIRFKKPVAVDFEDTRLNEISDKSYRQGQVLRDVALEENVNGFLNIHFENGDLAIGVPKNSVEVIA